MARVALIAVAVACACEARFAQRLVAPALLETRPLERGRTRPKLELGPYVIETLATQTRDAGGSVAGPARTSEGSFRVRRSDQVIDVTCTTLRSTPGDATLAAVADRNADRLAIDCEALAPTGRYAMHIDGRRSENLAGDIRGPDGQVVAQMQLLFFYSVFGSAVQREAPAPVAQAYIEGDPVAAMVLTSPERAWLDAQTGPVARDVLMALMVSLRLTPGLVEP